MRLLEIGILLIVLGIAFLFIGSFLQAKKGEQSSVRAAGGIFIGPFPLFGFASDKQMFYALLVLIVILTVIFFVFGRIR